MNDPETKERSPTEAAGYIAGTLTGAAQMVMPVRMWVTVIASLALITFALKSDSLLDIARACCAFASLISVLIASAVFSRRSQ